MAYKPRSLFSLIEQINQEIFLPHIQRPFVWDEEQMIRLFDSLMRNYPIQTLLFWRTREQIMARRFMPSIDWDADLHDFYDKQKSAQDVTKVFVLDGQQRLQTLYAVFNGTFKSPDERSEREAYFDVTSGMYTNNGDIVYGLRFENTPLPAPFYRLRDMLGRHQQKNAYDIADELNRAIDQLRQPEAGQAHNSENVTSSEVPNEERERDRRRRFVERNVAQLVSLLREEKHFWVQELDGIADRYPYKVILDIFVRVNSGGTKLSAADLMFAAMKEDWAEIEQQVEEVVDMLNENQLRFDKELILKCIVVASGRGAELTPAKFTSQDGDALLLFVRDNWVQFEETFRQLRDFIYRDLQLFGDKVVRSYNSFVPLFDYLFQNPRPTERSRVLMRAYYYKSQLFNWYAAQTDVLLNAVHNIVGKPLPEGFPLERIKDYFANRRMVVELVPEHMNMRLRFILLNLIYTTQHGVSAFNVRYRDNEPHIDHIYPQSALRKVLRLPTAEINDLGNYRFVGAIDNIRKRAESPETYFTRLKESGVDIRPHLLVDEYAQEPQRLQMTVLGYRQFRDVRRAAIFEVASRVVNAELSGA